MSYDIYCYKSKLGYPSVEEAKSVIEVEEEAENDVANPDLEIIAKSLIIANPNFERFENELNTPEGDIAIQIHIFDNNISIGIPYWYSGDKALEVVEKADKYLKIIREVTGYFTYDPQAEEAFDSKETNFQNIQQYAKVSEGLRDIGFSERKKPWWKFW